MSRPLGANILQDIQIYQSEDFPKDLVKLNDLYQDLFSGGKGFRSKMVSMVCSAKKVAPKTEQLLCQTIEFIHNSSLLHDDLIDRAPMRRGKTSAWLKYNPEYAVLAGDYLLARVMMNLSRFGNIHLIQFTSKVICDLLEGEWLQDSLLHERSLSQEKLHRVHELKTASLFEWCIRSPFIAIEDYSEELHKTLSKIGRNLGTLFQRGDDLLDFDIRNSENKKILGDLTGGYLNSFAAFLVKGIESERVDAFFKCRSMPEVNDLFGENFFNEKLAQFDAESEKMMEQYQEDLKSLSKFLSEDEASLMEEFLPLAKLLYWRS
ncbi:MAG: polyprenyl synthetase family protein [Bdellovibrionota bacterium]|nr:polyprenyl synthetase family protein [Bdellovibrionota bacterium]